MRDWTDPHCWTGVCPELARRFGFDVWAVRIAFLLVLFLKPMFAIVAYVLLAIFLPRPERDRPRTRLRSASLSEREARIADLERRFRDLERESGH